MSTDQHAQTLDRILLTEDLVDIISKHLEGLSAEYEFEDMISGVARECAQDVMQLWERSVRGQDSCPAL